MRHCRSYKIARMDFPPSVRLGRVTIWQWIWQCGKVGWNTWNIGMEYREEIYTQYYIAHVTIEVSLLVAEVWIMDGKYGWGGI
jgi:hypothetical protein